MKEALDTLYAQMSTASNAEEAGILKDIESWMKQMEPEKYSCLGCEHCYPAAAMNVFYELFPDASRNGAAGCGFEMKENDWPPVAGEYFILGTDRSRTVAATTLASAGLAERLSEQRPEKLCIVGKLETENIGIDKIIRNTVTNPAIRFLIVAGMEPKGHLSGRTLLALMDNGVDKAMRVIGSSAKRPVLKNVTIDEVNAFRTQVRVIDMIGCENAEEILQRIMELPGELPSCGCAECESESAPKRTPTTQVVNADENLKPRLDKAGYFVIIPQAKRGLIVVEHYANDNTLWRIIEGKEARNVYLTIIENEWITEMSHAAYLGKELEKAELSMKMGFKYIQDGA